MIRRRAGFTLIEVVLAMAITALVMVLLYSALRVGYRSEERGSKKQQLSQRIRASTDRLAWLIAGAYPYKMLRRDKEDRKEDRVLFEGDSDSLLMVTTSVEAFSDDLADRDGLKVILIAVGEKGLSASEAPFINYEEDLPPELVEYVFEPEAESIRFEYMDAGEDGDEKLWSDTWSTEDTNYLPVAVKATLTIKVDGEPMELPPVIVRLMTGGQKGIVTSPLELKSKRL